MNKKTYDLNRLSIFDGNNMDVDDIIESCNSAIRDIIHICDEDAQIGGIKNTLIFLIETRDSFINLKKTAE
jgi:hypothetical protein